MPGPSALPRPFSLQSRDERLRRNILIREAAGHVPLERLALSPQCGFASGEAGNPLTPDQQAAKLRRVGEVARRVWPTQGG